MSALLADDGVVSGYLQVANEQFALHVDRECTSLCACPKLRAALAGHEEMLAQRLQRNAGNAQAFVGELTDLLEGLAQAQPRAPVELPSVAYYELLVRELDTIGWGALQGISASLDEVQLLVEDTAGREHILALSIPPDYPRSPPTPRVSLPAPFELRAATAASSSSSSSSAAATSSADGKLYSLSSALSQFRQALARHQLLWTMLDDLDAHTWVLEPKRPTRDCVSRRIALGDHCSLQISLHVAAPASLPELQFLGADRVIAPLRHALNANLAQWSGADRTVRLNLQAVLQRDFPPPPGAAGAAGAAAAGAAGAGGEGEDEYAVECAICYMYELEGTVPECACDGCAKPFHKACLSEWLRGLPTTQQSFNRLYGECPYCSRAISCEATDAFS